MDPVRLGHAFRALRIRRGWRQSDLAARAGVSASTISRIERGRISDTIGKLRCVSDVLEANLDIRLRWNGEGLDRLLDQAHAELVESFVRILRTAGWTVEVEWSFAIAGERGSIDVAAYHPLRRMVLVAEVKSVVPASQATIRGLDRKARLAPQIARAKGRDARGVARLLAIGDSSTSSRRIAALSTTYGVAFPTVGRAAARRIRDPVDPISGLLFLRYSRRGTVSRATTGVQRVRAGYRRPGIVKRS